MADGDELRRIGVRLAQLRQARSTELAAAITAARSTASTLGGSLGVGAVVFDTVSGQEGVVIGGTRANVVVPGEQRPAR